MITLRDFDNGVIDEFGTLRLQEAEEKGLNKVIPSPFAEIAAILLIGGSIWAVCKFTGIFKNIF